MSATATTGPGRWAPRPGPVEVKAPRENDRRVDDETGERKRFSSKIHPPWCRKHQKISEVLPLLHFARLVVRRLRPGGGALLGGTAGLSAATVTRLTVPRWATEPTMRQIGQVGGPSRRVS
ncbi:hypothetical protein ABK046_17205 [Streptomyces caeruleatus]